MNINEKVENLDKQLNLVAELYLRMLIRNEYPEWVGPDGECKKCEEYYDSLLDVVEIE